MRDRDIDALAARHSPGAIDIFDLVCSCGWRQSKQPDPDEDWWVHVMSDAQEAALRAGGSLDEAWAEAEAALQANDRLVMWQDHRGPRFIQVLAPERPSCECGDPDCDHLDEVMAPRISILADYPSKGLGDGPVVELQKLAATLRGPQATEPTGSASSIDLREGET